MNGDCLDKYKDEEIQKIFFGASALFQMNGPMRFINDLINVPNWQHTALWAGDSTSPNAKGVVFAYGNYYPTMYDTSCDGARINEMTLAEFQRLHDAFEVKELKTGRNMTVGEVATEISQQDIWRQENYNWRTHNCQHFTAEIVGILEATIPEPTNTDKRRIPSVVMNKLVKNDYFLGYEMI